MSSEAKDTTEQQASASADASLQALISSWKAVFHSLKLKVHSHSDLVAADFRLSVKAIVVTVICVLLFVGLALVLWSTLMFTMAYALVTYGLHWLVSASLVILLNIVALIMVKQLLGTAIEAISMKASAEALLSSEDE